MKTVSRRAFRDHRVHLASALLLPSALALGCAAPTDEDSADETLGQVSQPLSGWIAATHGTTTDLVGLDTGAPASGWTCFLSGVIGDLSKGRWDWEPDGVQSAVSVTKKTSTYWLRAHGGAAQNQQDQQVWDGNRVMGSAVCVPYATVATNYWQSYYAHYPTPSPKRIAGLADSRQCFLTGIRGGYGIWDSSAHYARVVKITTTDADHPTTGWYVESNLTSDGSGGHARVDAACFDLPYVPARWPKSLPASGSTVTTTLTSSSGVKACGLTMIKGAFTTNSWSSGVWINAPTTADGTWTMTATANKAAEALCLR
jgi:hypothetical protein